MGKGVGPQGRPIPFYATFTNSGGRPDRLLKIETGAAHHAILKALELQDRHCPPRRTGRAGVPANGRVSLRPGTHQITHDRPLRQGRARQLHPGDVRLRARRPPLGRYPRREPRRTGAQGSLLSTRRVDGAIWKARARRPDGRLRGTGNGHRPLPMAGRRRRARSRQAQDGARDGVRLNDRIYARGGRRRALDRQAWRCWRMRPTCSRTQPASSGADRDPLRRTARNRRRRLRLRPCGSPLGVDQRVVLLVLTAYILYEAYRRFQNPPEIVGGRCWRSRSSALRQPRQHEATFGGSSESLNVKGAYFEVLSDMLGSLGVIVAAIVVMPPAGRSSIRSSAPHRAIHRAAHLEPAQAGSTILLEGTPPRSI